MILVIDNFRGWVYSSPAGKFQNNYFVRPRQNSSRETRGFWPQNSQHRLITLPELAKLELSLRRETQNNYFVMTHQNDSSSDSAAGYRVRPHRLITLPEQSRNPGLITLTCGA